MNELWVARDAGGDVWMFLAEPQHRDGNYYPADAGRAMTYIDDDVSVAFNLRPGECRRLVMESEVSE